MGRRRSKRVIRRDDLPEMYRYIRPGKAKNKPPKKGGIRVRRSGVPLPTSGTSIQAQGYRRPSNAQQDQSRRSLVLPPGSRARWFVQFLAARKTARVYLDELDTLVDEWREAECDGDRLKARFLRLKVWPLMTWVWVQMTAMRLRGLRSLSRVGAKFTSDDSVSDDSESS